MPQNLERSLIRNTYWSIIGKVGYLIISLITNIVLVRNLGPETFGTVSIVMLFVMVSNVLVESGLGGALVRKENVQDIDYSTVFYFNIAVSLGLLTVFVLSSSYIAAYYNLPILEELIWGASFILIFNALKLFQVTKLIRDLDFKKKSRYEIWAISIASLCSFCLLWLDFGIWAVIYFHILNSAILTILLWTCVERLGSYRFSMRALKSIYSFGLNTTLASLLSTFFDNIYQLALSKYFSVTHAGYYYQAKKLQDMPNGLIQNTFYSVMYSGFSRVRTDEGQFNHLHDKTIRLFTIFNGLLCTFIFFYAEQIILLLFGYEWHEATVYLKILVVAGFLYLQELFYRMMFKVFDKTRFILRFEILKRCFQSLLIVLSIYIKDPLVLIATIPLTNLMSLFIYNFGSKATRYNNYSYNLRVTFAILLVSIISIGFITIVDSRLGLSRIEELFLLPLLLFTYCLSTYLAGLGNIVKELHPVVKMLGRV
ncbi:lipopolysaccharide biosynthesis protein [Pseudidiomarina salilacus]|uniref:lipopolysaccharide biosynthesis protein n=1 Tax=Pseudidiomarina salilacus TaxID=3384452 RepID=UPI0039846196